MLPASPHQFNRPPRVRQRLPTETVVIPGSPPERERLGRSWSSMLPALLTTGTMVAASLLITTGRGLLVVIPMAALGLVTALISAVQIVGERRQLAHEERRRTREHQLALEQARGRLAELSAEQQRLRRLADPEPEQLLLIAGVRPAGQLGPPHARLWERRPGDPDFLALRLGLGSQPSSITIDAGPAGARSLTATALLERYSQIREVPMTLDLRACGSLGIAGPRPQRDRCGQTLLWQLATHHAPAELRIAALYPQERAEWSWLRWLPHSIPLNGDAHSRMLAAGDPGCEELLVRLLDELSRRREGAAQPGAPHPQLVILIDSQELAQRQPSLGELISLGREQQMSVLLLVDRWEQIPGQCGAMLDLAPDGAGRWMQAGGQWQRLASVDQAEPARGELLGRALAALDREESGGARELPRSVRLLDLLNVGDERELLPPARWSSPPAGAWHPDVPIGQGGSREQICLDLREHHHGPHGIIAGTTGAGKSELLQTIIAALAILHAPDRAQFLLIDFKGGAALRVFQQLPHTVGLVTDLQGRLAERAMTAIKSEIRRRKELLGAVEVKDIAAYRALAEIPEPLANLLIVVDEFDELVKEQPDFVAELIRVVKQGRSLGVHLLLATQQPGRSVRDEIKSQLQYWLALRLGSAEDSREMLQRPDAFFLPTGLPGRGYLRVGTSLSQFQAARVGGCYRRGEDQAGASLYTIDQTGHVRPLPRLSAPQELKAAALAAERRSDLEVIVAQLAAAGRSYQGALRPIWCPPLPPRLTLMPVLELSGSGTITTEVKPASNLDNEGAALHLKNSVPLWRVPASADVGEKSPLRIAIGLLDIPQESRREALALDLGAGHVAVFGSPGSGKTVLLRTLLLALALQHSPADVWCYLVDSGGQGLSAFRTMPHAGGIVQAREVERVRRIFWMLRRELQRRQELFRAAGAADLACYRQETGTRVPAILLVIDKLALFREEHEDLVEELATLARTSRAYGIHLVVTADRPGDMPHKLAGLFETRIVLRLSDESDSSALMGRRSANQLPLELPGRGFRLLPELGWLEFQVALPYLERGSLAQAEGEELAGNLLDAEVSANLRGWMAHLAEHWHASPHEAHAGPPRVRLLPELVRLQELWRQQPAEQLVRPGQLELLAGLESQALEPAGFQLDSAMPALLVVGGPRSGKTTALRTLAFSALLRHAPEELGLFVVDPRGSSFRDLRGLPHLLGYASGEGELAALAEQLAALLERADGGRRYLLCIDDFELGVSLTPVQFSRPFMDGRTFLTVLESLASLGRERGFFTLVASSANVFPLGLLAQLNAGRSGLVLRPHDYPAGSLILGLKLPLQSPGDPPPAGRALMVCEGAPRWIQLATPGSRPAREVLEEASAHGPAAHSLHAALA